jgi:hypothetical protein
VPVLEQPLHRNLPEWNFTIQNAACPVQVESKQEPPAAEICSGIKCATSIDILTAVFTTVTPPDCGIKIKFFILGTDWRAS